MTGVLSRVADLIDPDAVRSERPELRTPVTLAAHLDKTYQVRAHLEVIGEELASLERGDFDRLMVNTPPRVGKTRTAVEWFVFWWLCRHPSEQVIVASYDDDLARRAGQHIRKLVNLYGARYGLVLERGSAAVKHWSLATGGGVRSVGIGSGITGHDGDLLIVDDPTKSRAEAESVARRDAIYNWWSADLMSRSMPNTKALLVQTPWHPDDLRARVVKQEGDRRNGGRWRVCLMAALCEDPSTDPLNRDLGEPIPHPRIRDGDNVRLVRHWEAMRAQSTVRDWRSLYQCDPHAPEGALVSSDLLRERRCFETRDCSTPVRKGVAIDPSGGGRDTAGVVAGFLGEDGRCHFTHDASGVMPSDAWGRAACELAADTEADFFVIEKNYGGDMVLLVLRTAWDVLRREQPERFGALVPRIVSVVAKRGKMLRAEPIGQQWKEGRCVTANYLPDLESEWATHMPGSTDSPGRIDASVYLAYELLPVPNSGEASLAGAQLLSETSLLNWGR